MSELESEATPTTPTELLDEALDRYDTALDELGEIGYSSSADDVELAILDLDSAAQELLEKGLRAQESARRPGNEVELQAFDSLNIDLSAVEKNVALSKAAQKETKRLIDLMPSDGEDYDSGFEELQELADGLYEDLEDVRSW